MPSRSVAGELSIAVASNFIAPIKKIATQFKQETGHSLRLSFGSSGKFYAQIKNNAPFDVFLSADLVKPRALSKEQLALPDSLTIYAKGKLVLWSVKPINALTLEAAVVNANRIAIANPTLAPYGKAAEDVLKHLTRWDSTESKRVQGENISQTYQFVYSQNADLGFVALSQVRSGRITGYTKDIPTKLYRPINQGGVILSRSENKALAATFMTFLMRADTQAQIINMGYAE
ncbi:molybdate ABC transporter substrate-binding protein [Marinomonas sp. IMCC 4694]|nr:molybdate ABC transporter substrate-binding protein [Marinomonas sp. IMCC 4694]